MSSTTTIEQFGIDPNTDDGYDLVSYMDMSDYESDSDDDYLP